MDLELHTRRLQDIGLNAYESRAYLVLIGHSQFKALEVAGRANIPRQKIYEVLDSLVEKGFVRVVQGKAKQFSAVEPRLALEGYLARKRDSFERAWQDRQQVAGLLGEDLDSVYAHGNQGQGPLDYLRIVADAAQIAEEYRRLLLQCQSDYLEFARPPYGSDPLREPIVQQLLQRDVSCRLLFDAQAADLELLRGTFGSGRGDSDGGEPADEAGLVRWRPRHDLAGRSSRQQSPDDRARVRAQQPGVGDGELV